MCVQSIIADTVSVCVNEQWDSIRTGYVHMKEMKWLDALIQEWQRHLLTCVCVCAEQPHMVSQCSTTYMYIE